MQRWLAGAVSTAAGGSEEVRRGKGQDERPTGWVKGTKLTLKRGHVSRSQSNTLAEGREPGSGRMSAFGLDNRAAFHAQALEIHRTQPGLRSKRRSNFVVRYPPFMIRHTEWRIFTS